MQTDKASKKCNAYSHISLFLVLLLIIFLPFSPQRKWVKKTFLKICFKNNGVKLQVILQSGSLVLERGKYDGKQEIP